jgi:transcriptional regulator with XRE-family HTH domain
MDVQNEIKKLTERIERSGFSVTAVCRRAEIQQSSFIRWAKGGAEPRISSLNKIERALNALIAEALE